MGNAPMTARLAEVLNRQLRDSNLSVSETSRKTGIPYPTLYRRLNNAGHGLTIDETERLAGAHNPRRPTQSGQVAPTPHPHHL